MNKLNCKNLSLVFDRLKKTKNNFDSFYESEKYSSAQNLKVEITKLLEAMGEMLDPAEVFLSEVEKKKFWDEVIDRHYLKKFSGPKTANPEDAERIFQHFEKVISRFPKFQSLKGSDEYLSFMEKLVSNQEIADQIDGHGVNQLRVAYSILNSCFLNKYLEENQEIDIEELPEELRNNFACFLKRGNLHISCAGLNLAAFLKGGQITADEACEGAGDYMSGGTLKIINSIQTVADSSNHLADRPAGYKMSGGTLYIENTGSREGVATGKQGGTVITPSMVAGVDGRGRGAILFSYMAPMRMTYKAASFYYSVDKKYVSMSNVYPDEKIATSQADIFRFWQDQTLIVVDDLDEVGPYPSAGMNGGVLVFRDVPKGEIGKGMKNGVVIIENDKISIEDAKSRISKDRPGGVILMRVWDRLGIDSQLIDLEK